MLTDRYNRKDFDECAAASLTTDCNLHRNTKCLNTIGTFFCSCADGFDGNDYTNCTNIDECIKGACGEHGSCVDTIGSFTCLCNDGYKNWEKNYSIEMKYSGVGIARTFLAEKIVRGNPMLVFLLYKSLSKLNGSECIDRDECAINLCGDNMICTNSIGSFECSCRVEIRVFSSNLSCIFLLKATRVSKKIRPLTASI